MRKAHTHYLAALTSKSHLGVRPLMEGLHRLLGLCRRFCAVFLNYSSASDIPHAEVGCSRLYTTTSRNFITVCHRPHSEPPASFALGLALSLARNLALTLAFDVTLVLTLVLTLTLTRTLNLNLNLNLIITLTLPMTLTLTLPRP